MHKVSSQQSMQLALKNVNYLWDLCREGAMGVFFGSPPATTTMEVTSLREGLYGNRDRVVVIPAS